MSEHCIENSYELAIVMPAFNEEAGICGAVTSWKDELTGLGIKRNSHEMQKNGLSASR